MLILSTNADQKSIKQGFLLSFVARLAIVNTVSCDYYPRSSIVKSISIASNPVCLIELCALPDVVSFSNYEKTTPAKRTIIATAGIQNEKSCVLVHK